MAPVLQFVCGVYCVLQQAGLVACSSSTLWGLLNDIARYCEALSPSNATQVHAVACVCGVRTTTSNPLQQHLESIESSGSNRSFP